MAECFKTGYPLIDPEDGFERYIVSGLCPPEPNFGSCCDPAGKEACVDFVTENECDFVFQPYKCEDLDADCTPNFRGACCDADNESCIDDVLRTDCPFQWVYNKSCQEISCEPIIGACCDGQTGTCIDGLTENQCGFPSWYVNLLCAQLDPPCDPTQGACCDEQGDGECFEDVPDFVCEGLVGRYLPNQYCRDFDPPCAPLPKGACCNRVTKICTDDVIAENCSSGDEVWYSNETCADIFPPCDWEVGACCITDDQGYRGCTDWETETTCDFKCFDPFIVSCEYHADTRCIDIDCSGGPGACCKVDEYCFNTPDEEACPPDATWHEDRSCGDLTDACIDYSGCCVNSMCFLVIDCVQCDEIGGTLCNEGFPFCLPCPL